MPNEPRKPSEPPPPDEAWQPKVDPERTFHSFANVGPDAGASPTEPPPKLRDPDEDTAPLQGSGDRSDEDSLLDDTGGTDTRPASQSGGSQRPEPPECSGPHR